MIQKNEGLILGTGLLYNLVIAQSVLSSYDRINIEVRWPVASCLGVMQGPIDALSMKLINYS